MGNDVVMRVAGVGAVVRRIDVDGTEAGLATTVEVGTHVGVEHEVPDDDGLAHAVDRTQGHILHIGHQAGSEVATVVPGADGALGEDQRLLGSLRIDVDELVACSAVVMIGCACHQFRAFVILAEGVVDLHRIVVLIAHVVVVVVVVEDVDLRLQAGTLEGTGHALHQLSLFGPRHVARGAVGMVQRLVLGSHSMDADAFALESLDELDEILGVGVVVQGAEVTIGPRVVGTHVGQIVDLHPLGGSPGAADDLEVGIDGKDLLEDGDHVVDLIVEEGEMLEALHVAQRILGARKVVAADRDAAVAHAVARSGREGARQEVVAVLGRHLQKVVARRIGDAVAESVNRLLRLAGIELDGKGRKALSAHHIGNLFVETVGAIGCRGEDHSLARSGLARWIWLGHIVDHRLGIVAAGREAGSKKYADHVCHSVHKYILLKLT